MTGFILRMEMEYTGERKQEQLTLSTSSPSDIVAFTSSCAPQRARLGESDCSRHGCWFDQKPDHPLEVLGVPSKSIDPALTIDCYVYLFGETLQRRSLSITIL